ncbi:carboxymuconolactone decarboxylase family protein [Anaeromicropila herbilytica]|uniref:Carboxymuconolactone decarboxylase n=1 Tax=Anaeromicropila herbilytica TaxID=2785025 RepID=A0A7R7EJA5_9FIRM|nr:carboxymuconolactone decarboxylase family protein [Anaeromicropila herbilytica]BCN29477.1 carboxymuconolactone decarboxylase [Anaeromicropila herbilytica]
MKQTSNNFQSFIKETGEVGVSFMNMVMTQSKNSALDPKTNELAYISVLAAVGMVGGIPFHVKHAKSLGASREEVKSAVLVGLPAVGLIVTEVFDLALASYDEE